MESSAVALVTSVGRGRGRGQARGQGGDRDDASLRLNRRLLVLCHAVSRAHTYRLKDRQTDKQCEDLLIIVVK